MKSKNILSIFLPLMLFVVLNPDLRASSSPSAKKIPDCISWKDIFLEKKISVPLPLNWNPDQCIASGALSITANSILVAYFPKQATDALAKSYFFGRYDAKLKTWKTCTVIEKMPQSIGSVQEIKSGFLVEHPGHTTNRFTLLGANFEPSFDFYGDLVEELPGGNIYTQFLDDFGDPAFISVINTQSDIKKQVVVIDRTNPVFKGFTPCLHGHVIYNSCLDVFGVRIDVHENRKSQHDDIEDMPIKFQITCFARRSGPDLFRRIWMKTPLGLQDSGDQGFQELMSTEKLAEIFKQPIPLFGCKNKDDVMVLGIEGQ